MCHFCTATRLIQALLLFPVVLEMDLMEQAKPQKERARRFPGVLVFPTRLAVLWPQVHLTHLTHLTPV